MTRQKRPLICTLLALSLILCLTVAAPIAHATEAVPAPEEVFTDTSDDSCTAVDLSEGMVQPMSTVPGSRYCLVSKAQDQVGNYYDNYGGSSSGGWCGMFVSWCARNSNVSTSVIPDSVLPEDFMTYYSPGQYYSVDDVGVTWSVMVGDLCFSSFTGREPAQHISIVTGVGDGVVYTIDGSLGDYVKEWEYYLDERADADDVYIRAIGFARPAYGSSSHSWNAWSFNAYTHWRHCANCNALSSGNHSMTNTGECSVCRYNTNISINQQPGFVSESQTPWRPEE